MKSSSIYGLKADVHVYDIFDQSGQRYLGQVDMMYIMCASFSYFNCKYKLNKINDNIKIHFITKEI